MSTKTVPTVYHSSKTVKRQSNSKKWPLVYQSSNVYTEYAECTKPHKRHYTSRDLHHMCLGSGHSPSPVGRTDCMCLNGRPCVWLPFAAACCYTLLPADDACSSSSLSTTVIKFSIISDPTRKFSLSRLNSVEYGNCKTTTLLPSTKCTRPLFQGWTGCSGRPSGWHDIVTCQRLVWDTIAARQYQLTKDYPLKAG